MSDKKKKKKPQEDYELEEKKASKPPAGRAKSKETKSDLELAVEAAKAKKAAKKAKGGDDSDPDDIFGSSDEEAKSPRKKPVRQETAKPEETRDWLVSMFDLPGAVDVEGDAETCCISCCCPCIGVAQAQTYIKDEGDEACLQAGVLYCFMSPLWCCWCGLVRGAYRETVGVEGNGCTDCLAGCLLPCCASAQMIRDYHVARVQGKLPSKKKKKSVGRVKSKEQVPREEKRSSDRKPQTDRSERPRDAGTKAAPQSARDEKRPRPAATTNAAAATAGPERSVSSNRSDERKKVRQDNTADSLAPPQRVKSRDGDDRRASSSQGSGSSAPARKPAAERKSSQTRPEDESTPAARSKSRDRDDAAPQRAPTKKSSDSSSAPRSKSRDPEEAGPARVQSKKASTSDKKKT